MSQRSHARPRAADGMDPVVGSHAAAVRAGASRSGRAGTREREGRQQASPRAPAHRKPKGRRLPLVVGAVVALVVVGTSFPAAALVSQHKQLSTANAQLDQLRHQNQLLAQQRHDLTSSTAIGQLARQEYQLVAPGQSLYQVLPANGSSSGKGSPSLASGHVVDPADAPDLSPDPGATSPAVPGGRTAAGSATGASRGGTPGSGQGGGAAAPARSFWARVGGSLAFWQ